MTFTYGWLMGADITHRDTLTELNHVLQELGGNEPRVLQRFLRRAVASPTTRIFVARLKESGQIIGTATANIVFMSNDIEGRVDNVAILQAYRGKGIGDILMREVIAFCVGQGAVSIELTCAAHRAPAEQLYLRHGFEERSTRVYRLML